jgi:hypothetical protein
MMASDGLFNFGAGPKLKSTFDFYRIISKAKSSALTAEERKNLLFTLNSIMIEQIHNHLDYYEKFIPTNYSEEKQKFFNALKKKRKHNPQFAYADDSTSIFKYLRIKKDLNRIRKKQKDKIIAQFINTYQQVADILIAWRENNYRGVTEKSGKLFGSYKQVNLDKVREVYKQLKYDYSKEYSPLLDAEETGKIFLDELKKDGLKNWQVKYQADLPSEIMIFESRKTIVIKSDVKMTKEKLTRFMHHEIKGHTYQTMNALTASQKYYDWYLGYIGTEPQYQGLALFTIINNLSMKHTADTIARYLLFILANGLAATKSFYDVYQEIYKISGSKDFAWLTALRSKRGWRDTSKSGCFQKDNSYILGCLKVIQAVKKDKNNYTKLLQGSFPLSALPYVTRKTVKWKSVDSINESINEFVNQVGKVILK